jgi:tRNA threonylcarbamoyladenosine biosynthesis protein TsaE
MRLIKEIVSSSSEETKRFGRLLGRNAESGDIVLLIGDLGAGKTTFTQGIAEGIGVNEPVRSPTFVLVLQYQGRLLLNHIDLYRIGGLAEVLDMGLDEYLLADGISIIEWANRASDAFPQSRLEITLEHVNENERLLNLAGYGDRHCKLLRAIIE